MKKLLLSAIFATATAGMVSADANDAINSRKAAMKAVGAAAKAKDFAAMNKAAMMAQEAFKTDTTGKGNVKTTATPAIWTEAAKFDGIMAQLVSLSAAGDAAVFGTCKSCHEGFRVKN